MTHEERARAVAKRFTHRTSPASVSMARSLVTLAERADAHPDHVPGRLMAQLVDQLRECGPQEDGVERIQAKMWVRRVDGGLGLPPDVQTDA